MLMVLMVLMMLVMLMMLMLVLLRLLLLWGWRCHHLFMATVVKLLLVGVRMVGVSLTDMVLSYCGLLLSLRMLVGMFLVLWFNLWLPLDDRLRGFSLRLCWRWWWWRR